ncbi:unnamed protein product, partial [Mycena citricolor]
YSPTPQEQLQERIAKRRNETACINCRKRKTKCMVKEQPPVNPCQRCIRLELTCIYPDTAEPLSEAEPEAHLVYQHASPPGV